MDRPPSSKNEFFAIGKLGHHLVSNHSYSIVAVHGLNGDQLRTWTAADERDEEGSGGVNWLKDLLPFRVPGARIMTFGFHADVRGNTSSAGIEENAKSLLSYLVTERQSEEGRIVQHSLSVIVRLTACRNAAGQYCGLHTALGE